MFFHIKKKIYNAFRGKRKNETVDIYAQEISRGKIIIIIITATTIITTTITIIIILPADCVE